MDDLELSESPWHEVGIFYTCMGLGRQMGKEFRSETDTGKDWVSTWYEESWDPEPEGVTDYKLGQTQSLSERGCFLSKRSQYRLGIAWMLKQRPNDARDPPLFTTYTSSSTFPPHITGFLLIVTPVKDLNFAGAFLMLPEQVVPSSNEIASHVSWLYPANTKRVVATSRRPEIYV